MPYQIFLGIGIFLVVVCLVVRDRTEYRISRLRAELMALRTEEKRQADVRDEVELMIAQAGEALMRGDRRCNSMEKGCQALSEMVEELRPLIPEEDEGADTAAVDQEGAPPASGSASGSA